MYLSRHVVFYETIFPYANPKLLYSPSSCNSKLSAFSDFSNDFLQHHISSSSSPRVQSTPSLLGSPAPATCPAPLVTSLPPPAPISPNISTSITAGLVTPQLVPCAPESSSPSTDVSVALQSVSPAPGPSTTPSMEFSSSDDPQTSTVAAPASSSTDSVPLSGELCIDLPIAPAPAPPAPTNTHPMLTRKKAYEQLGLVALKVTESTEPKSVKSALQSPHWLAAMRDELSALKQNHTWELVPRKDDMNVVGSR